MVYFHVIDKSEILYMSAKKIPTRSGFLRKMKKSHSVSGFLMFLIIFYKNFSKKGDTGRVFKKIKKSHPVSTFFFLKSVFWVT